MQPRHLIPLNAALAVAFGSTAQGQTNWTGATSNDWNTAGNWSSGVPNANQANINVTPVNIATITANPVTNPARVWIGNGAGAVGRLDHTSGLLTVTTNTATTPQQLMLVGTGAANASGIYNLADTAGTGGTYTGYATGSGSLSVVNTRGSATEGRLFIGGDTAGNDGGTGLVNVNTTGSISVRSDILVGQNAGSGTLNIDNGTITSGTSTNGAWTSVGFTSSVGGPSTGTVRMSNGTFNQYGRFYVGRGIGSSGTLTMSGGTLSTVQSGGTGADDYSIYIGNAGSTGTVTMSGNSTIASLNHLKVGDAGTATFSQSGSSVANVSSELWIGNFGGGSAVYHLNNGTLNVGSWVAVGRDSGSGTLNIAGGTLNKTSSGSWDGVTNVGSHMVIGAIGTNAVGTVNVTAGLLNVPNSNLVVGETGTGSTATLNISGGEVRAKVVEIGRSGSVSGHINLDGGTLKTERFMVGASSGTKSIDFNGTLIVAQTSESNFLSGLTTANVETGGILVDTNSQQITIAQDLTGTGKLEKSGAGVLTLSGTSSYTGNTLVSAGTLLVTGQLGDTNVTVGSNATIGGDGILGGDLAINSGGKLDVTGATIGLTSTGTLEILPGGTITLTDFGFSSITGWDGSLASDGTYTLIGGADGVFFLGSTPTISNPFAFSPTKFGYFKEGSLQAVIYSTIPEPGVSLLGCIGVFVLLGRRRV